MWDEINIYAKLESPLYGSLIHVVEVTGLAVQADIAAARIFELPSAIESTYVSAARLNVSPAQELAIHDWPKDEDSLFEYVREQAISEGIFRPRELMDELAYSRCRFYRRIEACSRMVDSFCISVDLKDLTWCTLAFLRCNTSPVFDDQEIDTIERLKPAIARLILSGFQKEAALRPNMLNRQDDPHGEVFPLPVQLAKLSKTERQVLNYLRSNMTERQIANALNRSPHTVHVHVKSIYRKLDISSRKQLMDIFNHQVGASSEEPDARSPSTTG